MGSLFMYTPHVYRKMVAYQNVTPAFLPSANEVEER